MDGPSADAYRAASEWLVELVGEVGPDDWDRPGLGEWSVRELVGHANRAHTLVVEYLDQPRHSDEGNPAYFAPQAIAERGRQAVAGLGADPAGAVAADGRAARERVTAMAADAPVGAPSGVTTLAAYLPSRTAELVLHGQDLAAALGIASDPPPAALAEAAGFVAGRAVAQDPAAVLRALAGRGTLPPGFTVYP